MSDEHTTPAEEVHEPVGAAADPSADAGGSGDSWRTVLAHIDELAEAVGRWAKAAVNDPDNRRRAQELKSHIERMVDRVGEAVDDASESEAAEKVKDAADKAGDAIKDFGEKVGDEVLPRMASAFETAAGKLSEAAAKIEEKADGATEAEPGGEEATE